MAATTPDYAGERDMDWRAAAAAVHWDVRPFVDGAYRASAASESFDDINPATETSLCQAAAGDAADVERAVRVARERFDDGCWSGLPPARRAVALRQLADLIVEHHAELALLDSLEMGKPIQAALADAGQFAPEALRSWAGFADKLMGASVPLRPGTLSLNVYEPRGVVGAITAWNFPTGNAIYKIGPALAAGNTMVLKPSELAPSSALKIAELALEAGVPEGVLNVVPGLGRTVGEALALHPGVDFLSFTGSTATGQWIMRLSGRSNAKPLLLECGGKSAHVVFDDIDDLDAVASAAVRSVVWNQGQVCGANTRLLVHDVLKDPLLDEVVSRASMYRPADPLDESTTFGPLASPGQRDRVRRYIEEGLQAGAVAVLKGEVQEAGGCYVSPTIFDRVSNAMSIVQEEIFGPVLCVQTFTTEDEATRLVNGTSYGLGATVWTRDIGRARRLAHAIRAGHIGIRTSGAEERVSAFDLGFEPQGASGFGAELGLKGLESYSTLKVITFSGA